MALRNRLRISRPGSYFFGAGGGLGFGLAGALGVQLALPDRRVVCVLGEGSAQYAITGFWTAAAYNLPITFLVLRNDEYAILKWFADLEYVTGAPGLDLPALDTAAVARATASRRSACPASRSCAPRSPTRSPPTARAWSRSASRPGCRSSEARSPDVAAVRAGRRPAADRRRRRARGAVRAARAPGRDAAAARRAGRPARVDVLVTAS